jgi:hypothetical protein
VNPPSAVTLAFDPDPKAIAHLAKPYDDTRLNDAPPVFPVSEPLRTWLNLDINAANGVRRFPHESQRLLIIQVNCDARPKQHHTIGEFDPQYLQSFNPH